VTIFVLSSDDVQFAKRLVLFSCVSGLCQDIKINNNELTKTKVFMRNNFLSTVLLSALVSATTAQANATYQVCDAYHCFNSLINTSVEVKDDYTKTKYPIVFVHGINGYAEKSNSEYWPSIPTGVYSGGANVYVTTVAAFDSPLARGEQLLERVRDIKAITGADKVNLIAHSQGAQTVRYVAAVSSKDVSTVTSVAGTNKGTPVASLSNMALVMPGVNLIYVTIALAFNYIYDATDSQDYRQHLIKDLTMLSPIGAANFNARYPQAVPKTDCGEGEYVVNGIPYYSWGGTKGSPVTAIFFGAGLFRDSANDTIVPRCSTHLGKVIRDNYPLSHTGLVNRGSQTVDVVAIYRKHANFLKAEGY